MANMAKFTTAECLLIQAETGAPKPTEATFAQIAELLDQVQLQPIAEELTDNEYCGNLNLARARLELLKGNRGSARKAIADAAPDIALTSTDPYEQKMFMRVSKTLSSHSNRPLIFLQRFLSRLDLLPRAKVREWNRKRPGQSPIQSTRRAQEAVCDSSLLVYCCLSAGPPR